MGLLPCLRRGSERWWLPQTERSTDAIGHLLLMDRRSGSGNNPPLDGAIRDRVCHALQSDPAYFIHTALTYSGHGPIELDQLATWHAHNITGQIASGDAYLGAPNVTPTIEKRWRKLTDHFRTIPISRWMEDAPLWLEVTGPKVSNTWREQWPIVRFNSATRAVTSQSNNHSVLQELARSVQHQKSLESAFDTTLHGEKLAAIKQLAYGLSHEINNPLANISTRAEQLQRGETDSNRTATLQRIIDQVYRAHEMIADLMFYANPPELERQACAPSDLLSEVAGSFTEEAERQAIQIQITAKSSEAYHPQQEIRFDATMIKEAIRALIRNSIDAIGCQGTIVLSLQCDPDNIAIVIADSGPGLSEQAQKHAFDPYFSGREAGRGLGLGLCRAYRIAKLHEGEVSLASGPSGCVATLTLPVKQAA
ncbi:HAMP domain-containing histidine kinase [Rubripirellula sp.]|jgi:signal transduction histidine kinase|nr:HAMP domain-containing histidine kinase [Rubripirellula sp.]